jgi:hypothetical protein
MSVAGYMLLDVLYREVRYSTVFLAGSVDLEIKASIAEESNGRAQRFKLPAILYMRK